jgi:hypothetical protein
MNRVQDQGWERAYVFFKHEDAGTGPRLAKQFLSLSDDGKKTRKGKKHT